MSVDIKYILEDYTNRVVMVLIENLRLELLEKSKGKTMLYEVAVVRNTEDEQLIIQSPFAVIAEDEESAKIVALSKIPSDILADKPNQLEVLVRPFAE